MYYAAATVATMQGIEIDPLWGFTLQMPTISALANDSLLFFSSLSLSLACSQGCLTCGDYDGLMRALALAGGSAGSALTSLSNSVLAPLSFSG